MNPSGRSAKARVSLRPLTEDDIAAVEPLYREAVRSAEADPDAGLLAIVREADGAAVGVLDYRANSPARGWLSVGFIALAERERGWGHGSEAVRVLEAGAKAARFRANVDAGNGLALYFWLRLGYRPARPDEVPGRPPRGIITMIRTAGGPTG